MANYSAAFGYDVYILPLFSNEVDIAFTGITAATGTSATTNFIKTDSATAGDGLNLVTPSATISYSATTNKFTVESTLYGMDGEDQPFRLYGLTNAALETDTSSEDIVTYDDETKGFNTSIATSKSWSVSLEGVADFRDAGYQILRLTEQNTVAGSLRVKFVRVGPTGTDEAIYGYGTLQGYSESIEAGSIVSWSATLQGYGPYKLDLDANP
ncbi:MAG: phage tail tube protein [Candidatus Nanopelagicaceae bacterium]